MILENKRVVRENVFLKRAFSNGKEHFFCKNRAKLRQNQEVLVRTEITISVFRFEKCYGKNYNKPIVR